MLRIILLLTVTLATAACGAQAQPTVTTAPPTKPAPTVTPTAEPVRKIDLPGKTVLSISPDGSLFAVYDQGDLCLYDVASLTKELCAGVADPSLGGAMWSPDSRGLALAGGQPSDLYLLNVATGEVDNLSRGSWSPFFHSWSPDSHSLIVGAGLADMEALVRVPIDGDEPSLIRPGLPDKMVRMTAIAGDRLVYDTRSFRPGESGLWIVEPGADARQVIDRDPQLGPPLLMEVSAQGNRALVFYPTAFNRGAVADTPYVALADLSTGALTPVRPQAALMPTFTGPLDATFAPDGSRMAYVVTGEDAELRLIVRDLGSDAETIVTALKADEAFSNRGSHLTWTANNTIYLPLTKVLIAVPDR